MDAEVGIIGVGTMGSMVLWQLARRGISVMGFEQFHIGHDRSAAGGETRVFRTAYKEGHEYVPLIQESYRQWLQLEQETGTKLLNISSGLLIGDPKLKSMKNIFQSIEKYHLSNEVLNAEEAKMRYPQHHLLPNEVMIVDHHAGYIHPHYAILSAVQRAKDLGAKVLTNAPVEKVENVGGRVQVVSNGKVFKFNKVIVTIGPYVHKMVPGLKNKIEIRQLMGTWFAAKDIKQFSHDKFPVFMREFGDTSYYGFPSIDGGTVKISLSSSSKNKIESPAHIHQVKMEDLSTITSIIEQHLPELYKEPVRINTYIEGYSVDNHPIIGYLPGNQNIVIMAGFSGHGFKLAPVFGRIGADLILDEHTPFSIERFSPNRFLTDGFITRN